MRKLFLLALPLALGLAGCSKEEKTPEPTPPPPVGGLSSSQAYSLSEGMFNDLHGVVDEAGKEEAVVRKSAEGALATCADITFDTAAKTMTIDFGNGCTDRYQRTRKGKLVVTYTGRYSEEGSVFTVVPQNYSVNGFAVEGTHKATNIGKNAQGQPQYAIQVRNGKVTSPAAEVYTWESDRVRTWTKGHTTLAVMDDEYEVTGSGSGTTPSGESYTIEITEPLQWAVACKYIKAGKLELRPENVATRYVDYGNGECDNRVDITVNGQTYIVYVP